MAPQSQSVRKKATKRTSGALTSSNTKRIFVDRDRLTKNDKRDIAKLAVVVMAVVAVIIGAALTLNRVLAAPDTEQEAKWTLGLPSPMPSSEGRSDSFDSVAEYQAALPSDSPVPTPAPERFVEAVGIDVDGFIDILTLSASAGNVKNRELFNELAQAAGLAGASPAEVGANPDQLKDYLLSLSFGEMQEVAGRAAAAQASSMDPKDPGMSNAT